MNKQLQTLANTAGFKSIAPPLEKLIETFGTLIVKKCADIALHEDFEPSENILNYFGIDNDRTNI